MKLSRKILTWYSQNVISRWTVFAIDGFLVVLTFWVSLLLQSDLQGFNTYDWFRLLESTVVILLLYAMFFLMFRSFVGIIRHTSAADANRIFLANSSAATALLVLNILTTLNSSVRVSPFSLPLSLILTHYLLLTVVMIWSRFTFKSLFNQFTSKERPRKRYLIYGAGSSGRMTMIILLREVRTINTVVAFLDDDERKHNKTIEGVPIYSSTALNRDFLESRNIDELIVSIQNIEPRRKKSIVDLCLNQNIQVKVVPPLEQWMNGELSLRQIAPLAIEELLQRDPINLNNPEISRLIREKVVLVTGAAGSIGFELVKQLMHYDPAQLILVDQAETPLHELQLRLTQRNNQAGQVSLNYYVADISDTKRMRQILRRHRPQMIFHAAAYKHVPLMEENPMEAVRVNVLGTSSILHLAREYGVARFVMVSTDKAVNPTNVMGASKRLAEIIAQAMADAPGFERPMEVVTTRFGNVLGSNGSVIPLFKRQMEAGGPITVTHPEITRYFMTIPEACQLVLEAATMGQGGEIYVFDMGEPVKIADLAYQMVRLSGLQLGKDIMIKYIGLRPGEKLYEELLAGEENTLPTHHPKILVARVRPYSYNQASNALGELRDALHSGDDYNLVSILKKHIPEFISNNSRFSHLDKERKETVMTKPAEDAPLTFL
jgi:FlaA1/EpsC-like NDP-sugar epimerase